MERPPGGGYRSTLVIAMQLLRVRSGSLMLLVGVVSLAGCAFLAPQDQPRSQRRVALEQRDALEPEPVDTAAAWSDELSEEALPTDTPAGTPAVLAPEVASTNGDADPPPGAAPASAPATTDSESVLRMIGPTTPPQVAAALRLVEEGRSWLQRGQTDRALERFERAVAVDPANVPGYYFLARGHLLNRRYDQAEGFVGRGIDLATRVEPLWQARLYSLQGDIFEAVGRFPQARDAYQRAIYADPANASAQAGLSRLSRN